MEAIKDIPQAKQVTLYRFEREAAQFCHSPYVNKLDALLTFSALENVKYQGGSLRQAPHGKLPYIEVDGTAIPDSELAYNSCIEKRVVECLDKKAGLNAKESAISRSIQALVERNLIEMMMYERWIENWHATRNKQLTDIPALIRTPAAYWLVYRPFKVLFWGAGIARFSAEERQRSLEDSIRAFAALTPESGYIMGKSTPTRIDATAFGFLVSLSSNPELSPKMITEIQKYPHVLDYQNRLFSEFWPQRKPVS